MQLSRLDVSCADLEDLPVLVSEEDRPLVIRVSDADTVTAVAGVCADWSGSWGVWLEVGEEYSIGPVARDVRTLARLLELDHVVLEAPAHAEAYAEALEALLGGDEVTLSNEAVTLSAVVSRPAAPSRVTVWSVRGDALVHGQRVLHRGGSRGAVTLYVD